MRKRNCASPRFRRALALLEWQNSVLLGRLLPADGSLGATVGEMLAQEHWEAMELIGRYAAANHSLIHRHLARHLRVNVLLDVENHHNFAWKERHVIDGVEREVVV